MGHNLLKLGLLICSYWGYWEFFRTKCKINIYFTPLFTVACQFVFLFLAGILNYLKEATVLTWLVGLVLLIWFLRKKKLEIIKPYLTGGYLFFAVMFVAVMLYTNDRTFSQIDNFTHWATVVKNMLGSDRFPNSLDTAVEFTSYPLGSSVIIYYITTMTSSSEHMQMVAQTFMMLCALLPIFVFAKKHIVVSTLLITMMAGFLFQYNIPVTELLVDTLLPLAGMATITFAYYQCVIGEDGKKLPVYYTLPVMLWTMNIKHAALLYMIETFILLCIATEKEKESRKLLLYSGLVMLAARSLWNRHCSYIDPDVSTSQHTLSVDWFSRIVGEKTAEDIIGITQEFLEYVITRRELLWILAWMLLLSVLAWILDSKWKKVSLRFVICGVSLYVIYAIGLLGMYVFSMPVTEGLMAVDRYMKSGDVAIYYLILTFAVAILAETEGRGLFAVASVTLLAFNAVGWRFQMNEYRNTSWIACTAEQRQRWEAPIAEYGMVKRKSYLLCIREEDDEKKCRFPEYVWQYNVESSAVAQIIVTDESQLENEEKYDYVVIFDEDNPVIQKWVRENYPDKIGSQVIQHFH